MSFRNDNQDAALRFSFGQRVQSSALKKGFKQADLARSSGIDRQHISSYWNGKKLPMAVQLFALADALGVDARWLLTGKETAKSTRTQIAQRIASLAGDLDEASQNHLYETASMLRARMSTKRMIEEATAKRLQGDEE